MDKNIAFIPVRGGSKSIPQKNIKKIAGKPLVYWTIESAINCKYIYRVYVSTDSEEIIDVVKKYDGQNKEKIEIVLRSKETASDKASTESAMLEFAEKYEFENIVLIQATSPLLETKDLDKGFEKFKKFDSVISLVEHKRFHWQEDENGIVSSINYDYTNRPRRQEFKGDFVENGAFYITSKKNLLKYKNRLAGKIGYVIMPEETYFEIDEPSDWAIIENLLLRKLENKKLNKEGM